MRRKTEAKLDKIVEDFHAIHPKIQCAAKIRNKETEAKFREDL